MVKIIVDSTCDLPEEVIHRYSLKILPLRVYLKDKEFLDKITIKVEEVYNAMKNGIFPKTSQPSPIYIHELFKNYASKGYDFIYLSFSSKLSGTYQTAYMIVEDLKKKYPNVNMKVIDSKAGSAATGLIAMQAAKLAEADVNFNTIVNVVKELSQHIEHIFTISNLHWLIKGGRISKSSAMIGDLLKIKPILQVFEGAMNVTNKVRGRKKALKTITNIVEEKIKKFPNQIIGISHADDIEMATKLKEMMEARLGEKQVIISKIGSVLGSHLGLGGVGVFFFNKKPSIYMKEVD